MGHLGSPRRIGPRHAEFLLYMWLQLHPSRHNEWLKFDGLKAYLRRTVRMYKIGEEVKKYDTLDLSTFEARVPGRGAFTKFLTVAEQLSEGMHFVLYVENVLPVRFRHFFRRRGYVELGEAGAPPCFYRIPAVTIPLPL